MTVIGSVGTISYKCSFFKFKFINLILSNRGIGYPHPSDSLVILFCVNFLISEDVFPSIVNLFNVAYIKYNRD